VREIGRGERVFEAPPVQGTLVAWPGGPATGGAGQGAVVLLDDASTPHLPDLPSVVAIVCTGGGLDDPVAALGREARVPCVVGVTFDGSPPPDGTLCLVDCSGDEGVVMVVDGGVTEGGLEDVVATQSPPA
jgi:phosphohistidine swiveling domain-containing protein